MLRSNGPGWARCLSSSLLLLSLGAHGQSVDISTYQTEYLKRLKSYQTIQPYGDTPFGESIDLATGQISFSQTDIVLEGTGPTIRVTRTRIPTGYDEVVSELPPAQVFRDWSLNIPRITTLAPAPAEAAGPGQPGTNWRMDLDTGANSLARCTRFGDMFAGPAISLEDWWHGYELVLEDGASQPVLQRDPAFTPQPATGGPYPAITASNVQIGCLPATKNGQAGEAFFALAPDGTKYTFDWMVGTMGAYAKDNDTSTGLAMFQYIQQRMQVALFVTRIEDRFGNFLTYNYDAANPLRLLSIVASDGRKVSFAWSGNTVISATAQPDTPADARTWRYGYTADLSSVTLPDNSKWTFDIARTGGGTLPDMFISSCTRRYNANAPATDTEVSTITAPSGLVGTFTMRHRWHARSYAGSACLPSAGGGEYESVPPLYENLSLIQRTLTGAGVPMQVWQYAYSPATASAKRDACAQTNTCADTSYVDVTEPDGARTRYTHSTRDGVMDGKLVKTDTYEVDGTLLRTEVVNYPTIASLPFQSHLGYSFRGTKSNVDKLEYRYPSSGTVITQQGREFRSYVQASCGSSGAGFCFDAFGRPTRTVKLSQPAP